MDVIQFFHQIKCWQKKEKMWWVFKVMLVTSSIKESFKETSCIRLSLRISLFFFKGNITLLMCLWKHLRFLWLMQGWANGTVPATAVGSGPLGEMVLLLYQPKQASGAKHSLYALSEAWRWCHGSWPSVALRFVVGISHPHLLVLPSGLHWPWP